MIPVAHGPARAYALRMTSADPPPDADLWFLPGPPEPAEDTTPAAPPALADPAAWAGAEAAAPARLARAAARLAVLDERLRRAPPGWTHRLALIEAAELGWLAGDRIAPDRLALWLALRLSSAGDDHAVLLRLGWAVRRLSGGPGPLAGLAAFLGRHDPGTQPAGADLLSDRAAAWTAPLHAARDLHPLTRACMGFHLWPLAGLSATGDRVEAAVTAARLAAEDCDHAVFAPLALGGAGGLRAGGPPAARLARWLDGAEAATRAALRHLAAVEDWSEAATAALAPLSGRTPPALVAALAEWPLLSAPMAEEITGASRAAVQRNLLRLQQMGLLREVTGQGRFRLWRAALRDGG